MGAALGRISVIGGDGIGPEVTAQALRVLERVAAQHHLTYQLEHLDYGAERFLRDGTTLPPGELERLRRESAAIFLGALGDPRIPDMRHGREILLALRFELDLFVNFRPVRCLHDRLCPLRHKSASDVRLVVFRENTEGPYVGVGGQFKRNTPWEVAINEDINTRRGVERIVRAAFTYAAQHGHPVVTMADKSNAMRHAHDLWQRVFAEVGREFPSVRAEHQFIDALVMHLVRSPERFAVIVTNNLFGDIVTDLGAALQGGMGMAASANFGADGLGLFEPVHGSAPDIAGQGIANPLGAILTVALMLERLGQPLAAQTVEDAVRRVLDGEVLTSDLGGRAGTREVTDAVLEAL